MIEVSVGAGAVMGIHTHGIPVKYPTRATNTRGDSSKGGSASVERETK